MLTINTVTEKAVKAISQYDMIRGGDSVCAALSGGADSVALLLVLSELSEKLGFALSAVHVNHLLRGDESDRDEAFCRSLCGRLNIPLTVFREDAAAFAKTLNVSVETGAREMRYRLFDTISADKIASAHNLNDNAETLLFRLARGTGLRGLCGIPPVRKTDNKIIIRPLLFCSREEIEEYLRERGQDFVTDSTNLSDDYARNKIRHRVIPELTAVHGGFPENIIPLTVSLSEDEDFLGGEAERHKNDDLRTLHPAVKKRVIINLLKSHKLKISAAKISEICDVLKGSDHGKISLNNGYCAICENGHIKMIPPGSELPEPQIISGEGKYFFYCDKFVIIIKETDEKTSCEGIVNKKLTSELADYDKIQGGAVLRNRLRSDRIKPAGQPHTRELRKLLQERLPREEREVSAVIADETGVIWAEHVGFADRVLPDENTKNFLKVEIFTDREESK